MQRSIGIYYSPLVKWNIGTLAEDDMKHDAVAMAYMGNGIFQRVQLSDSECDLNEELKSLSSADRPKFILHLRDENSSQYYDESKTTLFYMVEEFTRLPYRVRKIRICCMAVFTFFG